MVVHETATKHDSRQRSPSVSNSQPFTPRAVLVLKNKPKTDEDYGDTELPNGKIEPTDLDMEDALCRFLNTTTGLHFDQILGTLTSIQLYERRPDFAGQVNVRFVVSVTETTSLDTLSNTPVTLSHAHDSYRWILENYSGRTEVHLPIKHSQHRLITTAFDTVCYGWRDTMEYLSMAPMDLKYTDRFNYIYCAAVVRIEADTSTPQILLIQRGEYKKGAGNWEFPGGKIDYDATTLHEGLCSKILSETGLSISKILGSTRKKPSALPPRRKFVEDKGLVNLAYLVKVDDIEVVKLHEDYSDWKWIGSVEEAGNMKMTFSGLKTVREALAAVAEGVRAGGDV